MKIADVPASTEMVIPLITLAVLAGVYVLPVYGLLHMRAYRETASTRSHIKHVIMIINYTEQVGFFPYQ
jgi:orotidine-5'-phosphate decarboxylase